MGFNVVIHGQMTSKVHRYQVHLLSTVHSTCSVHVFYIFFDLSDGILVTMWPSVHVLETASCRNVGKGCVHKTQSGQTLSRTLRKQELRAPGCPFE
jgi:hypothetical protein